MSHEIEQRADGTGMAVYNRIPAWHRLGKVANGDEPLTLTKAMKMSGTADWHVRTVPIVGQDGEDEITTDRWMMTVRDNLENLDAPGTPLGVVTQGYQVVQNEEAFAFAEYLTDQGLIVECMASLKNGRQPFALFRMPEDLLIGGQDKVWRYLLVVTSHDGSLAVTATLTGIRVQCANMMNMALRQATPRYTVRHFGEGIEGRIVDAREALGIAFKGTDEFQKEAEAMLAREVTKHEFDKIVVGLFPEPDKDKATPASERRVEEQRSTYRALYEAGPSLENIRGTQWAAVQAAWEMDEWMPRQDMDEQRLAVRSVGHEDQRRRAVRRVDAVLAS